MLYSFVMKVSKLKIYEMFMSVKHNEFLLKYKAKETYCLTMAQLCLRSPPLLLVAIGGPQENTRGPSTAHLAQ
jgi:hypothetical protein